MFQVIKKSFIKTQFNDFHAVAFPPLAFVAAFSS